VKDLYFAAGCKVLAGEAGIMPLTSSVSYLAYIGDQTIIDTKDEAARQAAAGEGQEFAAKPGECDYFRRYPDAAEAARGLLPKQKLNHDERVGLIRLAETFGCPSAHHAQLPEPVPDTGRS
jgi:hypothetical protein